MMNTQTNVTNACQPMWQGAARVQPRIPLVVVVGEYLKQSGEYRYNVRSHKVEVKVQDETLALEYGIKIHEWAELTDRIGYTMLVQMKSVGIDVSKDTLYTVLLSSFSPQFDPVTEYLDNLEPWDGTTDYLKKATDRIVLNDNSEKNRRYLEQCFKKWMVKMVKSWLKEDEFNDNIFFLIGGQHTFKTTFIKYLLPSELRPYHKENFAVEMINKDSRIELSENLLINIDDISRLNSAMNGALKNLTSITHVKERKAYGRNAERYARSASFAATSNVLHILTDETGNRRWLTFHIKEIKPSPHPEKGVPFNYTGMYAQVKALIEQGFNDDFSPEEQKEVDEQNAQFMVGNVTEELLCKHIARPVEGGNMLRMSATEIYNIISNGKKIPGLSPEDVGRTLVKLGYEHALSQGQRKYKVQRIDTFQNTDILME